VTRQEATAVYASGEEKTVDRLIAQAAEVARLEAEVANLLSGLRDTSRRFCKACFERQQKIDRLAGEVVYLRQKLHYREKKAQEGYFGSSTPSSKKPIKPNSGTGKTKKKSGAKPGHRGHGRRGFSPDEADRVISVPVAEASCECGGAMESRGNKPRSVLELPPMKPEKWLYSLGRAQCQSCGDIIYARAPGVLPGWLYGNGLVSQAAVMHYVHGIPMGTVERMLDLPRCSLIDTFHDLAAMFEPVLPKLMAEYRIAFVKHADETTWRSQGQSGYAWIFVSENVCLFLFRQTRSGEIPREVFGEGPLSGVLGVDRYSGYSRVPCKVQFCYEHLKRNLEDLVKKYPDSPELKRFADYVIPMLKKAMKLRRRHISDAQFYQKAAALKLKIMAAMEADANDEAIRTYQEIFRTHRDKMYHWADDRRIPAHNNTAERGLRPTVIARKVSFGSQGDKGRKTREALASVLNTLVLRGSDPAAIFKAALDRLAVDKKLDPYQLLFGAASLNNLEVPDNHPVPRRRRPSVEKTTTFPRPAPAMPRNRTIMLGLTAAVVFVLFFLASSIFLHSRNFGAVPAPFQLQPPSHGEGPLPDSTDSDTEFSTLEHTAALRARNGPPQPNPSRPPPQSTPTTETHSTRN